MRVARTLLKREKCQNNALDAHKEDKTWVLLPLQVPKTPIKQTTTLVFFFSFVYRRMQVVGWSVWWWVFFPSVCLFYFLFGFFRVCGLLLFFFFKVINILKYKVTILYSLYARTLFIA